LGAQMALPFAASFVLLEEDLRWINEVKLRSGSPCDQLRQQGASEIRSHFLMPGDRVLDDRIIGSTGARPDVEGTLADIERRFAAQFLERRRPRPPDASRWDEILAALRSNAASRAPRILKSNQHLLCRIDLRDVPELSLLVDCTPERAHIDRCDRLRLAPMVLTTRFEILEALARQDYGFESISIGYGATLQLRRRDLGLRGPLLAVLGRKPLPPNRMQRLQAWLRSPWRAFAVWRRDLHWQHLALQMRRGRIQRTNDIYAAEPERWSPLRESPLPAARRA
jgi:hypothetical protein